MFEFLKSKSFPIIASFILGLGLVAIFKRGCSTSHDEKDCMIMKAPPVEEVIKTTYQIGHRCYQFKTEPTDCSGSGIVEPFALAAKIPF